jgi:hypothetical protein
MILQFQEYSLIMIWILMELVFISIGRYCKVNEWSARRISLRILNVVYPDRWIITETSAVSQY